MENNNTEPNYYKEFLNLFLRYRNWYLVSVVVSLLVASVVVRYIVPKYIVSAKFVLVQPNVAAFSEQPEYFNNFGIFETKVALENEMEILKSNKLVKKAVRDSEIYIKYYSVNNFSADSPIHYANSPIRILPEEQLAERIESPVTLNFELGKNSKYEISYSYDGYNSKAMTVDTFPSLLNTEFGEICLFKSSGASVDEFCVKIYPLDAYAESYLKELEIEPTSKTSKVANIIVNDYVVEDGKAFIEALMKNYNEQNNSKKDTKAVKTKVFLNNRIKEMTGELNFQDDFELDKLKMELQAIKQFKDSVKVGEKRWAHIAVPVEIKNIQFAPAMRNLETLLWNVQEYNNNIRTLTDLRGTQNENSDLAKGIEAKLRKSIQNILNYIELIEEPMLQQEQYLSGASPESDFIKKKRATMHETNIRDVNEQLYIMLLQKKEENDMTLAIDRDNLECIDGPLKTGMASREPYFYFLIALLIALAVPTLVIYLKMLIYNKLRTEEEVRMYTSLPILGSIPQVKNARKKCSIVVEENKNDIVDEVFRRVRTNLHFMMANKREGNVVMVTSTNQGEGKTFLASNLAMSLALLEKKVLLISLNIRDPKMEEVFGYKETDKGITTYLAADSDDVQMLDDFVVKTNVSDHLFFLPAGLVPPNPAELLARENLDVAIKYLKEKYDYVIVDSTSTSLVADAIIAGRVADLIVYAVNYEKATADNIAYINSLVSEGKLSNVSIVLNAENKEKVS